MRLRRFAVGLSWVVSLAAFAADLPPQVSIHDPVVAQDRSEYFLFSTGPGITIYSSPDLKTWRRRGRVFATEPTWARQVAPNFNGHLWAPDIVRHHGRYFLYYSVSAFGANTSAIGVAVNTTLDPAAPGYKWEDLGLVVRSVPNRDHWNAIDPAVTFDDVGTPWMSFGSFWSGLKLVKLAPDLVHLAEPQEWHTIARRARPDYVPDHEAGPAELEAPFIFKKGDFYYLFASIGRCCIGKDSTYRMIVGRAKAITGPYLDRDGRDLALGGGTLLLAGNADWAGVGHNSVYTFAGRDYLVFHAYETADAGLQKLKLAALEWDADLWPVVRPEAWLGYRSQLVE